MARTKAKPTTVKKRILVLGSADHTRLVTAYEWDKLPANLNVSDFDTIILNFVPFKNHEFARGLNLDLLPTWQQFARHLFSRDSEIIAIGSPDFLIGNNPYMSSTWWLPIDLHFVYEFGEDIKNGHLKYAFYFDLVRRWSFYLDNFQEQDKDITAEYIRLGAPNARACRALTTSFADTRFQRSIGFEVVFELFDKADVYGRADHIKYSGPIHWLPAPTETDVVEAIDQILKHKYGLHFETTFPKWAKAFPLPSQEPLHLHIQDKEIKIRELQQELDAERRKLAHASRFSKLLNEKGEDVLEPVVRDALRELGASVEDPKVKGREDGRLVDPFARNGMLEIKGRSGNLRLSDVRELDNWVRDAIAKEDWRSKGLLIANLQCGKDPRQRKNLFPSNCTDTAVTFNISIMTTTQLFQALVADQKGELDRKVFWDQVFASKGTCSVPELE